MSLPNDFTIRCASTDDADTLVEHRRAMFYDMGYRDNAALDSMAAKFRPWLLTRMSAGEYLAWLVIAPNGSIAAGAGLWLMDWPPHMIGAGVRRGNILNVYTVVEFRRRGLARQLMEAPLQWCRENRIDTIVLHASPDGRGLYESMGFRATNEMRINLETSAVTDPRHDRLAGQGQSTPKCQG
jgi:ribosomal protein S18 acetylase RimI-like enzyme